jgi:uncharacterized membrane protein
MHIKHRIFEGNVMNKNKPDLRQQYEPYIAPKAPKIVKVTWGTIGQSLGKGLSDFRRAPKYGLFFGAVFAVGGLLILAFLNIFNSPWMILPIMIAFPLVGPFVATGLYEVSHKLSNNEPISWKGILLTVFNQRERQTGWIAFVVLFIFWVWVYLVRVLIALFMGFNSPSTISGFINAMFTTQSGMMFLLVGTIIGAVLALILFSATVISMPLILDTELDFVTAMITSFQTVIKSPLPMLGWGVIVTLLAMLAMVPMFLGLIIVFPILGHATWHLYKAATEPVET